MSHFLLLVGANSLYFCGIAAHSNSTEQRRRHYPRYRRVGVSRGLLYAIPTLTYGDVSTQNKRYSLDAWSDDAASQTSPDPAARFDGSAG